MPVSTAFTTSRKANQQLRLSMINSSSSSSSDQQHHESSLSYNNGVLSAFHRRTQQEKISNYVAQSTYVNTEKLWNLAWHDSFLRNDLADFVPPLTEHLNVLMVGDNTDNSSKEQLPSSSSEISSSNDMRTETNRLSPEPASSMMMDDEDPSSFLSALLHQESDPGQHNHNIQSSLSSALGSATYDCILDRGLVDELLLSSDQQQPSDTITRLLLEATRRIREHGVYIVLTRQPFDDSMKRYLENVSELLGLQWQFDLDGISDETGSVSVARKFFKGELPSFGKLAKAQHIHPDLRP